MAELTYAEVGAVRYSAVDGEPLPRGYHHLRVQVKLGEGGLPQLNRASQALLTWQVHRAAGVEVSASAPVAGRRTSSHAPAVTARGGLPV